MTNYLLLLTIINFSLTLQFIYSQEMTECLYPEFAKYKSPKFEQPVSFCRNDTVFIKFNSQQVTITNDYDSIPWWGGNSKVAFKYPYRQFDDQIYINTLLFPQNYGIYVFDVNSDGFKDLFIEGSANGATGLATGIKYIDIFLIYPNEVKHCKFNSFLGGLELLRDYNKDEKFEFAFIKLLDRDDYDYYSVNFFEITADAFTNSWGSSGMRPYLLAHRFDDSNNSHFF